MREQRLQVAAGGAVGGHAVGAEAKRDRRVERVGQRERAAEKRPALTETAAPLVPDLDHARDVALERRPTRAARRPARVCTSSSRCAAPRIPSASRRTPSAPRPARRDRPATCPDAARRDTRRSRANPRRPSRRRAGRARAPSARTRGSRDSAFPSADSDTITSVNGAPRELHREPAAQRPRRVVLVADVECVHFRCLRLRAARSCRDS